MPARTREDFAPVLPLDDRRINIDPATRRIAVRVASWDDVHAGSSDVRMPRNVNLQAAHTGQAILEDGSVLKVGTLPMDTMHAPLDSSVEIAASHYENTGTSVARVVYSTDEIGIRADGVLFDDLPEEKFDRLLASAPSGDWKIKSRIRKAADIAHAAADFAGSCLVNFPGFASEYSKLPGKTFAFAASEHSILEIEDGAMDMTDLEATAGKPCGTDCTTCTCGAVESVTPDSGVLTADAVAEIVRETLVASGVLEAPAPELSLEDRIAAIEAAQIADAFDFGDDE